MKDEGAQNKSIGRCKYISYNRQFPTTPLAIEDAFDMRIPMGLRPIPMLTPYDVTILPIPRFALFLSWVIRSEKAVSIFFHELSFSQLAKIFSFH